MTKELLRLANGAKLIEHHVQCTHEKIVVHCQFDQTVLPEDVVFPRLVGSIGDIFKEAMVRSGWPSVGIVAFTLTAEASDDYKIWILTATPLEG